MSPQRPDPRIMRAVFNDPETLRRLSDIVGGHTGEDKTLIVNGKTYIVETYSTMKKRLLKD